METVYRKARRAFAESCEDFPQETGEVSAQMWEVFYKPSQEVAMTFSTSGENEIGRAEILALLNILKQFKRLPVRQADSQKLQYRLNKQYRYYITLIKLTQ